MYCQNCGLDNSVSANFCQRCGFVIEPLSSNSSNRGSLRSAEHKTQNLYVFVIVALVAVIFGGIGIFLLNQRANLSGNYDSSGKLDQPTFSDQTNKLIEDAIRKTQEEQKLKEIREKEETQRQDRAKVALVSLEKQMMDIAQANARSQHKSSSLNGCTSSQSDLDTIKQTPDQIEYSRLFICEMQGAILGVRRFDVGVKVKGELVKNGDDFAGRILDSYIAYDKEK